MCRAWPLPSDVRLDGKTALLTGANAGLGLEAAKELARHGASRVVLGVRNLAKGETAKQEILAEAPGYDVMVWEVDQESWASMAVFGKFTRLDIAILCAGVKTLVFEVAPTVHERNVQLGRSTTSAPPSSPSSCPPPTHTTTLTQTPSCLTIVASEVHFWIPFSERHAPSLFARLDDPDAFKGMQRYNISKLLNILWMRELSARLAGDATVVNAVNPGLCASALHRTDPTPGLDLLNRIFAWTSA
ncbi:NAD(P)-binding protein [Bimuria novae-zelandiae CBS 107.79]|uniref:NAD(P)-binding protein n=1 Tax=Bimuria novae-zelandiae CBS 107.79 TaxID=1447943 RepID=A0A6A5UKS9_9PLEO|nr:NAD(P)-binding protein [Bimuria novae-zelandiae CBS 107.79]